MTERVYKDMIWYGMAGIMVFGPLALGATRLWSITVIELVVLLAVFFWFWRMNNRTGSNFRTTQLDVPLWTFIALASVSCVFSIYAHDSLYAMRRLLAMVGIFYLAVNHFREREIERTIVLIIVVGTAISLIGLTQYIIGKGNWWWADKSFISSTYVSHNHYAGYLEMAIPLTIGFFSYAKTSLRKIGFACSAIVMIAAFIFAQSRGAWVSIAIAVVVMAFYLAIKKRINKYHLIVTVLSFALAIGLLCSGDDDIARRAGTMARPDSDPSFATRVMIWQGAIDVIRQNPVLGTGLGTFRWGYPLPRRPNVSKKVVHAHNDYLHMTAEMGLLALPLMLWMVIIVLRRGFLLAAKPLYAGVTIGLLSIFLHNAIDFNFHIPANMMAVAVLCAIIIITSEKKPGLPR